MLRFSQSAPVGSLHPAERICLQPERLFKAGRHLITQANTPAHELIHRTTRGNNVAGEFGLAKPTRFDDFFAEPNSGMGSKITLRLHSCFVAQNNAPRNEEDLLCNRPKFLKLGTVRISQRFRDAIRALIHQHGVACRDAHTALECSLFDHPA
jgi:hypothetical protein